MQKKTKPITPKQREFLKKMNFKNVNEMSYEEAKKHIDKFMGK